MSRQVCTALWMLAALLTAGCAVGPAPTPASRPGHGGASPHAHSMTGWPLADVAAVEDAHIPLVAGGHGLMLVETRHARVAWSVAQRMSAQLAVSPASTFLLVEGTTPNAYAFHHDGKPHIAANLGMLTLLADDEDAWAALWGHELAHLSERHREVRSERRASARKTSEVVGLALAVAGVPVGDLLAEGAATLVDRGYSRDEERDADRIGLLAMQRAGYDPAGAIRLQEKLSAAGGRSGFAFLSTHPGGQERVERMRELVKTLRPVTPPGGAPPSP